MLPLTLPRASLCAAATAVLAVCSPAQAQTTHELLQELRLMQSELRAVRAELDALKRQQTLAATSAAGSTVATQKAHQTPGASTEQAAPSAVTPWAAAPALAAAEAPSSVSLFGYGELTMSRPRGNTAGAVATARRGVLGFAYRFNERTRMAAELEIENAVVSASDQGEVAFEQLYIEHDIHDRLSAKVGLFLLPVGYMNETHEPTRYFGVHRNLVETAIIPSTWRELGVGLRGTRESGLRWDAGVVTGFDLTKWSSAGSSETQASPLAAIHQEGQQAKAATLATYGALNYDGMPGLNVGGSLYNGGAGQKQPDIASPSASVTLAELHVRWQSGQWDLSALTAQGRFHDVSAFNATAPGIANPVPNLFRGWYGQAAYRLWQQGDYSLVPFVRYEQLNTALGYAGVPVGLAPSIAPDTRVWTVGASYYLHPQVVLKIDSQRYLSQSALDKLNLGVGFHF
ncbi:hypothetical protein [Limnohabitans sp.]|uniref:hypothetical protein n=1 Tax=Limnohabitans sp. TaxID=1907725 RepID=UPI0038BB0514